MTSYFILANNVQYNGTLDFIKDENDGTLKVFGEKEAKAFLSQLKESKDLPQKHGVLANEKTKWSICSVFL